MSKQDRKNAARLERETRSAASSAISLREALAEDREVRRLEAQRDALVAQGDVAQQELDRLEDEAIAAEVDAEQAEAAESARRLMEEPPGSVAHAARASRALGLDHIEPGLFDALTPDAARELRDNPLTRELYDRSLEAFGTATMKALV